jgi:hypothetical protein
MQKYEKKTYFLKHFESHWQKEPDPNPDPDLNLFAQWHRSKESDPYQNVMDSQSSVKDNN